MKLLRVQLLHFFKEKKKGDSGECFHIIPSCSQTSGFLVVPRVFQNGAFSYEAPLWRISSQFVFGMHAPSPHLRLDLEVSFSIKTIVVGTVKAKVSDSVYQKKTTKKKLPFMLAVTFNSGLNLILYQIFSWILYTLTQTSTMTLRIITNAS